jgi:hypothetical protein
MPLNPQGVLSTRYGTSRCILPGRRRALADNAADIVRGDVAERISGIVHNSVGIGTHAVAKVKKLITGSDADSDAEA